MLWFLGNGVISSPQTHAFLARAAPAHVLFIVMAAGWVGVAVGRLCPVQGTVLLGLAMLACNYTFSFIVVFMRSWQRLVSAA